jgi:hypothetical protein
MIQKITHMRTLQYANKDAAETWKAKAFIISSKCDGGGTNGRPSYYKMFIYNVYCRMPA